MDFTGIAGAGSGVGLIITADAVDFGTGLTGVAVDFDASVVF